jgi:polyhydroxybutyrate depolymerase
MGLLDKNEDPGRLSSRRSGRRRIGARAPVVLGVLAAAGLVAACAGGSHSAQAPAAGPGSTLAAAPGGSGCGQPATAGSVTYSLQSGGHTREVIVHVPASYSGKTKVPLVLNLHGSESTAQAQEVFSGMDATSDADGFIVAYPQALIPAAGGYEWNIPGVPLPGGQNAPANAANDVMFLTGLVRSLAARYCVDTRQVYATGMSGGGRMASQLACDASQTFAAVAPVSGLRFPSPCPAARPVPVIAFHGTADTVDPFEGNGQPYWTYSVPTAAQRWAAKDACQAAAPRIVRGNDYLVTEYGGCASNAAVELYAIGDEGHEWPGGPAMPAEITRALGPQSDAVDADMTMWAFFQAHPLPAG